MGLFIATNRLKCLSTQNFVETSFSEILFVEVGEIFSSPFTSLKKNWAIPEYSVSRNMHNLMKIGMALSKLLFMN